MAWLRIREPRPIAFDFNNYSISDKDIAKLSRTSYTNKLATRMDEELTTEELMDLRVILVRFMADKEAHKKIPHLESRAPKLWDKVDRMYKCKQKGNEDVSTKFSSKTPKCQSLLHNFF